MAVSRDFLDFVLEQLRNSGRVVSRRMFGGAGLYLDGLFFALVSDDQLYFKVGDANRPRYEEAGSRPFVPFPDKPERVMGYWQVPADVLEDPEVLRNWVREACAVALAARGRGRAKPGVHRARRKGTAGRAHQA